MSREKGIPVLPVQSEGFKGNKRAGYHAACQAMFKIDGHRGRLRHQPAQRQYPGRLQPGREIWVIREYLARMGVQVVANITGDGRVADIRRTHGAALNLVAISGSTLDLPR